MRRRVIPATSTVTDARLRLAPVRARDSYPPARAVAIPRSCVPLDRDTSLNPHLTPPVRAGRPRRYGDEPGRTTTQEHEPDSRTTHQHETADRTAHMTERLPSVCPDCGGVYERDDNTAACPECKPSRTSRPSHYGRGSSTARGYGYTWRRLSERARRLSPQCEDCGATDDLTTDHSAEAWRRHELGQVIRLCDVAVVCRRCNAERGAARGARGSEHQKWERPDLAQLADELEHEDD